MKTIDLDSLLRLRHTSRIFMWLFSTESVFERYHMTWQQDDDRHVDTALVWTPPSSFFEAQAASQFGRMCSRCYSKRKGDVFGKALLDDMPMLYCSRCRKKHTIIHFSRVQRQLPETSERICIGHEGFFYICHHIVPMTWHQIASLEHDQTPGPNPDDMVPIAECSQYIHFVKELICNVESCARGRAPSVFVDRDEKQRLFMEIWVQRHISIKRLPSGKICANSLRKALEQEIPGKEMLSWMPQSWPVAGNPLRAFDPNICDCVEWHSSSLDARHVRWPMCPDPRSLDLPWVDADSLAGTEGRCSSFDHRAKTVYAGAEGVIRFERCKDREDLLVLFQSARYFIDDACGSGWENILYGPSYTNPNEDDMQGITWCPHPTCAVSTLLKRDRHLRSIETRQLLGSKWPREFLFL